MSSPMRMWAPLALVLLVCLGTLPLAAQSAPSIESTRGVALIIGNAKYQKPKSPESIELSVLAKM